MLNYGERSRGSSWKRRDEEDDEEEEEIREIHALTPPRPPPPPHRRRDAWEGHSRGSSSVSMASTEVASIDNFTSMSREFSALVLAGSTINSRNYNSSHVRVGDEGGNNNYNLGRIGEDEETNPLAIVADHNPLIGSVGSGSRGGESEVVVSVQRVKKEEVAAKISAWQNAKIAKINNRFKREDAVITAWETDHLHKATSWMKKVERKLEEKRARALEKMQNDIAKAKRKAEEKRASAEGKRGTKVARVLEMASLMRAVGKFPAKRSFF